VQDAAKRALIWIAEGRAGSGFTDVLTVARMVTQALAVSRGMRGAATPAKAGPTRYVSPATDL